MSELRRLLNKMPLNYQSQIENEVDALWHMKRMAEEDNERLRARILALHGYAQIALDVLQNSPWPTPNYEAYHPLEEALKEILAITHPKGKI